MASERQIEANRRNAVKSTGPRTQQGKARSRMNALRHGLSSTLSNETSTETYETAYNRLNEIYRIRSDMLAQLNEALVTASPDEIANALKRVESLQRYEARAFSINKRRGRNNSE